jgi:putative transposase
VNERWSMDFVSDQLANGRRFRVLNIVDDYSLECMLQVVDFPSQGNAWRENSTGWLNADRCPQGSFATTAGVHLISDVLFVAEDGREVAFHSTRQTNPECVC